MEVTKQKHTKPEPLKLEAQQLVAMNTTPTYAIGMNEEPSNAHAMIQ